MIEIVCNDRLQEEEETICLPKNIRQIGSPRGRHKIYIEDYVYTYIRSVAQKKESCAVVFLGKGQVMKDIRYTFISGAAECGPGAFRWDSISLNDNFWQYIFWQHIEEERKLYFPEKEIVGWFLGKTGQAMELTSVVEALHRKYFPGRDKVLMLMDALEDEEVFFIYDQGYLQKREGYYIYYEKNLPMQEYMIQKKEESLGEAGQWPEKTTEKAKALRLEETEGKAQIEKTACLESAAQQEEGAQKKESVQLEGAKNGKDERSEETQIRKTMQREEGQKGKSAQLKEAQDGNAGRPQEAETRGEAGTAAEAGTDAGSEFCELHKELEREMDPGRAEKIFAKSNLEEPKTQAEEALESYRQMILERQGRQIERQNRKFLYTASSFFLVAVCVLGITTINNYRKMQEVEDVLNVMNSKESEGKRSENEEGPVVESVMSQVDPLEENGGTTPSPTQAAQPETGTETSQPETAAEGQPAEQPETAAEGQPAEQPETAAEGQPAEQPETAAEGQPSEDAEGAGQETDKPEENAGEDGDEAEASSTQPQGARYYTVQPGDTLGSICISVYHDRSMMAKVCKANGIEDGDKIYIGQRLLLP